VIDEELRLADPLMAPYWEAATEHRLIVQKCADCGQHQFYPRPFCLQCQSDDVIWVEAAGTGTVYSRTTTHIAVLPDLPPPYVVALVELDEGPRLVTNIVDGDAAIGERVVLSWRDRADGPPLPVFRPITASA
jgi:uncharacterized OB-fold protein